jgi:protein-L-isoaspartate(D-aspartate) O-methyltransferase
MDIVGRSTADTEQDGAPARHRALIDALRGAGHIATLQVEAAFRTIPRHLFLPDVPLDTVYADEVIPTKRRGGTAISSSSQPTVMAIMLEQLDLHPGQRVLEIGAGTGYNAALMAHIVGGTGRVIAIDIDEDIVVDARAHVGAAGMTNVEVVCGDGVDGYPDAAPYDRIILTASAWDIAPAWITQLRRGGRLLLPLALQGTVQKLVAFERADDHLVSVSVRDGAFMPLRGAWAGPDTQLPLGPERGLALGLGRPRAVDAAAMYALLGGPSQTWPTPVYADTGDIWDGIRLWLALHAPAMCGLTASGAVARRAIAPGVFAVSPTYRATVGLLGPTALAVLMRPRDQESALGHVAADRSREVWVRSFGAGDDLAHALIGHLMAWEAAGRPSTTGLRIRAYPLGVWPMVGADARMIVKGRTRLVLDWPSRV